MSRCALRYVHVHVHVRVRVRAWLGGLSHRHDRKLLGLLDRVEPLAEADLACMIERQQYLSEEQ